MDGARRWPWVLGIVAGAFAAFVTWFVVSFAIWTSAGGTLGGLGASASSSVDWGRLDVLAASWAWLPVLVVALVPMCWAWSRRRSASTATARRRRTAVLGAIAAVTVTLAVLPLISLARDRAGAMAPADAVVDAMARTANATPERELVKREEHQPWIEVVAVPGPRAAPGSSRTGAVDTPTPEELVAITAAVPEDAGRWLCASEQPTSRYFEPAAGATMTWLNADLYHGLITASPQLTPLKDYGWHVAPCPR